VVVKVSARTAERRDRSGKVRPKLCESGMDADESEGLDLPERLSVADSRIYGSYISSGLRALN
jgi:hypothetical protein